MIPVLIINTMAPLGDVVEKKIRITATPEGYLKPVSQIMPFKQKFFILSRSCIYNIGYGQLGLFF